MTDLRQTIAPKSDQLNSDDLIGRNLTITITKVSLCAEADQPIAVNFEGDNNKPYKPCKSMRRVMVNIWGPDGNAYAGRRMTLYRDDKVQFGGQAVGGIRISHMSHIERDVVMALTATRANRKPFTVKPLVETKTAPEPDKAALAATALADRFKVVTDADAWDAIVNDEQAKKQRDWLLAKRPELSATVEAAADAAFARVSAAGAETVENDGWPSPDVPPAGDARE